MCGFLNGLFASDWDDINVIPTFIMTPLTYLGGIFFSISMLPGIWQDIALINPILYLINALRFFYVRYHRCKCRYSIFNNLII